jgi:hypothetical protein
MALRYIIGLPTLAKPWGQLGRLHFESALRPILNRFPLNLHNWKPETNPEVHFEFCAFCFGNKTDGLEEDVGSHVTDKGKLVGRVAGSRIFRSGGRLRVCVLCERPEEWEARRPDTGIAQGTTP